MLGGVGPAKPPVHVIGEAFSQLAEHPSRRLPWEGCGKEMFAKNVAERNYGDVGLIAIGGVGLRSGSLLI